MSGSWYKTIDGPPGFTIESFEALQLCVQEQQKTTEKVFCSLTLDEVSTCKLNEFDGRCCHGYIEIGTQDMDETTNLRSLGTNGCGLQCKLENSNWEL